MSGPIRNLPYDPTTIIGKTRLYLADDTIDGTEDFDDAEILQFLAATGNAPELAAARGLRVLASDAARLAVATKKGNRGNDETEVHTALLRVAGELERMAVGVPIVISPDRVFSLTTKGCPGSIAKW